MTAAVSQFMKTVNLPMTYGTCSKNKNVASSPACIFCAPFIAIKHPMPVLTYPQAANLKDIGEILFHGKKFSCITVAACDKYSLEGG